MLPYVQGGKERERGKKEVSFNRRFKHNGDFLHKFQHKAAQECGDKNMEGKRKFFIGQCQRSLLNSLYLYDD